MPKTDDELRALLKLLAEGAPYDQFPDGVTWADIDDAEKLAKKDKDK